MFRSSDLMRNTAATACCGALTVCSTLTLWWCLVTMAWKSPVTTNLVAVRVNILNRPKVHRVIRRSVSSDVPEDNLLMAQLLFSVWWMVLLAVVWLVLGLRDVLMVATWLLRLKSVRVALSGMQTSLRLGMAVAVSSLMMAIPAALIVSGRASLLLRCSLSCLVRLVGRMFIVVLLVARVCLDVSGKLCI